MKARRNLVIVMCILGFGTLILEQIFNFHFIIIIASGSFEGSVVYLFLKGYRTIWIGALVGAFMALMITIVYTWCWIYYTLPPHPDLDF